MAAAKKCDRCGKFYDNYNYTNSKTNHNGVQTLNVDNEGKYFSHQIIELCPECLNSFKDWLKEGRGKK